MQYYGYLRRTPEQSGYEAWLRVIRQDPNKAVFSPEEKINGKPAAATPGVERAGDNAVKREANLNTE